MNFPLYILLRDLLICVIICHCDKWLPQQLDWKVGIGKNNKNQTLIKKQWVYSLVEVVIEEPEVEIIEKIKKARSKDKEVVRIVEEMKKTVVKVLRGDEWQIEGDLVLKKRKVYIPKNKALRVEIIWLYHDVLITEHRDRWKMIELVTKNY